MKERKRKNYPWNLYGVGCTSDFRGQHLQTKQRTSYSDSLQFPSSIFGHAIILLWTSGVVIFFFSCIVPMEEDEIAFGVLMVNPFNWTCDVCPCDI